MIRFTRDVVVEHQRHAAETEVEDAAIPAGTLDSLLRLGWAIPVVQSFAEQDNSKPIKMNKKK